MAAPAVTGAARVGLIGTHGYGAVHLRDLDRLVSLEKARLVSCADVVAPAGSEAAIVSRLGASHFTDWRQMLDETDLEVVVIASPPHLHADMSLAAVAAGAHVLLEKPPVVTLTDFDQVLGAVRDNGVLCQVGFQSTGSGALYRLREMALASQADREVCLVATGEWQRDRRYWRRSDWAGRETLGGVAVCDGALSNPFAHAVMNCLIVLGADAAGDVVAVRVERYRANPIEVEDTAGIRVSLTSGSEFSVAVTLCAESVVAPALHLHGLFGHAVWPYEDDTVTLETDEGRREERFPRRGLLEELLDVVSGGAGTSQLTCPLGRTRPFVQLVEAVHRAPVADIPAQDLRWEGGPGAERPVIVGVGAVIRQASETGHLFSEAGAHWATETSWGEEIGRAPGGTLSGGRPCR